MIEKKIIEIKSWEELIEKIYPRPSLWIGTGSLNDLHYFLMGIEFTEELNEKKDQQLFKDFWPNFEKWVAKKYNSSGLGVKSFELAIILTNKNSNPIMTSYKKNVEEFEEGSCRSKAMNLWYKFYFEYKRELE